MAENRKEKMFPIAIVSLAGDSKVAILFMPHKIHMPSGDALKFQERSICCITSL